MSWLSSSRCHDTVQDPSLFTVELHQLAGNCRGGAAGGREEGRRCGNTHAGDLQDRDGGTLVQRPQERLVEVIPILLRPFQTGISKLKTSGETCQETRKLFAVY